MQLVTARVAMWMCLFACGMPISAMGGSAMRGSAMELVYRHDKKVVKTEQLAIAGDHLRVGMGPDSSRYLLFDAALMTLVSVDPQRQQILELGVQALEKKARLTQSQMQSRLRARPTRKDIPLGVVLGHRTRVLRMQDLDRKIPPKLVPTTKKRMVGGVPCQGYNILRGRRKIREMCVAQPEQVGLSGKEKHTLVAFLKHMVSMKKYLDGTQSLWIEDVLRGKGLPIDVRLFRSGGKNATLRLRKVGKKQWPSTFFTLPAYVDAPLSTEP
jgi:hypothetical protein